MNRYWRLLTITLLSTASVGLTGQLPSTDIYLIELDPSSKKLHLESLKYLSNFNQGGYNNQPYFFDDQTVYITCGLSENTRTDIYSMDLGQNTLTKITATEASEYSPTIMPNERGFSVIKVPDTPEKPQYLWRYPLQGTYTGAAIIDDLTTVGYHAWLSDDEVALFLVGDPHKLVIRDIDTSRERFIARNIGRTFQVDGTKLYYVQKISDKFWHLKYYDNATRKSGVIVQTLVGVEDYSYIPEQDIFVAAKGGKIFLFDPNSSQHWTEMGDLSSHGITNINRMTFQNNKLVFVNNNE